LRERISTDTFLFEKVPADFPKPVIDCNIDNSFSKSRKLSGISGVLKGK